MFGLDLTDEWIKKLWYIYTVKYCVYMCAKSLSHGPHFATPWPADRQALPTMGFSRQEHWSGLPCPPPADLLHPGNQTWVSCTGTQILYHQDTWE